jgi:hypothetical protein
MRWLLAVLLALPLAAPAAWNVNELFASLAKERPGRATLSACPMTSRPFVLTS